MSLTYKAYTLWMKWKNTGWHQYFTVKAHQGTYKANPIYIINSWMKRERLMIAYWKRGETWMIKPEGQSPAEYKRAPRRK